AAHRAEIDAAIASVLERGRYVLGDETRAFEAEFAAYVGVAHGVGVASGTDALALALRACGVGHGDEGITVAHTAVATVAAIEQGGAPPVMGDTPPAGYAPDPRPFARATPPRRGAVTPVHL